MLNVKKIFKKESLVAAAGLGAGSLAAEVVTNKIAPMLDPTGTNAMIAKVTPALPIVAGLLLATGTGVMKTVGYGMLASGVSSVAKTVIPVGVQETLGLGSDVMMGNVLMGEEAAVAGFASDSFDYTAASSGEMDY